jgi:ATP-dependent DNA helicase recG
MNFEYLSLYEIMKSLDLKNRAKFMQNYISPAIKAGLIERKYPEQPNHPNQRYRLTEKAMHFKHSQEEEQ